MAAPTPRKHQVSVYLDQVLFEAAREQMARSKDSLSNVIVEAARQSLLKSFRDQREQEILKAVERNFHRHCRMEKIVGFDLCVLKEMLGLILRIYLNHTPPVPEPQWEAASRSGRVRFNQFLDMLAENVRRNRSILNDVATAPVPEPQAEAGISSPSSAPVSESSQSSIPPSVLSKVDLKTEPVTEISPTSAAQPIGKTNGVEQNVAMKPDSDSSSGRLF